MSPGSVSTQQRLISTYYDTPDLALKQHGLTLRIRQQGGEFIQNVKAGDPAGADILSRGEWEDALLQNRPDLTAPHSGAQLPNDLTNDLRPLFVTEVERTAIVIEPAAGTAIEAAIDEGETRAVARDAVEPISEIELELKRGDGAALYDLALELLDVAPIRIETRSKSERGYHLAHTGESIPAAVHAEPVSLDLDMTVDAALQRIGRSCLAQLLRNRAAVLSGQPEGVHQMRVAVRRLRSALSSLKRVLAAGDRRWADEELRWLGSILGSARNLDVFATELLAQARAGLPDEPGWEDLTATLDRLRGIAYGRITEAVRSERYAAATLRLARWFEARGQQDNAASDVPVGKIIPRILDRRRRKVRQRSKGFGRLTPHERHRLRIAAKKLRYTIELFGSLLANGELERFNKRLKQLQGDLGYANDVRVAHEFLPELFAEAGPRSPAAHAWVAVLEWHDQALAGGERKLRRHLGKLNSAAPFWRKTK